MFCIQGLPGQFSYEINTQDPNDNQLSIKDQMGELIARVQFTSTFLQRCLSPEVREPHSLLRSGRLAEAPAELNSDCIYIKNIFVKFAYRGHSDSICKLLMKELQDRVSLPMCAVIYSRDTPLREVYEGACFSEVAFIENPGDMAQEADVTFVYYPLEKRERLTLSNFEGPLYYRERTRYPKPSCEPGRLNYELDNISLESEGVEVATITFSATTLQNCLSFGLRGPQSFLLRPGILDEAPADLSSDCVFIRNPSVNQEALQAHPPLEELLLRKLQNRVELPMAAIVCNREERLCEIFKSVGFYSSRLTQNPGDIKEDLTFFYYDPNRNSANNRDSLENREPNGICSIL